MNLNNCNTFTLVLEEGDTLQSAIQQVMDSLDGVGQCTTQMRIIEFTDKSNIVHIFHLRSVQIVQQGIELYYHRQELPQSVLFGQVMFDLSKLTKHYA